LLGRFRARRETCPVLRWLFHTIREVSGAEVRDSSANSRLETGNRRSSRIEQAVPLLVTGVDALGRPFVEHTSTVTLNCHGCRYQSKHYVLKNMWVTLEVPHAEAGQPPRHVRAQVMWIQRPHNVRELFQVGVELDTPGNLWGIAFSPPDWIPFPDLSHPLAEIPASENLEFGALERHEEHWMASKERAVEDNLRTMHPGREDEVSATLARQMEHLVSEAKQQLHEAIRESATHTLTAEARPLIAALYAQLREGEQSAQGAGQAQQHEDPIDMEHTKEKIAEQAHELAEAALGGLREHWNRELSESMQGARESLAVQLGEIEQDRRGGFERQIASDIRQATEALERVANDVRSSVIGVQENLEQLRRHAEDAAAPLREIEQRLHARSEESRAQLEGLEAATRQFEERMAALHASAESGWQTRLEASVADAAKTWNERIETSIENAAKRAADELARRSQEAVDQLERAAGLRIATIAKGFTATSSELERTISERAITIGEAFAETISQGETRFAALQNSFRDEGQRAQEVLTQASEIASKLEEQAARIGSLAENRQAEFEKHISSLMETTSQELARRANDSISTWAAHLQPALEMAGNQTVARLGTELEQELTLRLDRTDEALARLGNETHAAEEMLRTHQDRITKVSEHAVEGVIERLQKVVSDLEANLDQSGKTAAAKWIGEIDNKATEATHTTFEALFKTADWYEKKVQTQMQAALEKNLEQATDGLREKAAEISRLFATELDHYSRSYVEHTQGQFEEAARDNLERVRQQSGEMAAVSSASVAQQAQNHVEAALAEFRGKADSALAEAAAQMENQAVVVRATLDSETQRVSADFRATLGQQAQQAVTQTEQALSSQVENSKGDLRIEGETQEKQLRQMIASLGNQAVDEYRNRLQDASDSWIRATIDRLQDQSKEHLEALARSAETRLHEACGLVFANVGETLRSRLLEFSLPPEARENPPANSQNDNLAAKSESA
jgi:hypothetical protein